jgi:hypothetical protein
MADEYDELQGGGGDEENGMTGPGAPTPLTALEVMSILYSPRMQLVFLSEIAGHSRLDQERYPARC